MTPSALEREEVLDTIYTVLTKPDSTNNFFLQQLVNNAKDGYFQLNLLKGLVNKLAPYPLGYLEHCIKQEQKQQQHVPRLEFCPDNTKVRKPRPNDNITASSSETDPFGFLVIKSSATGKRKRSSVSVDKDSTSSRKQQRGTYFTPYRPAFNYKTLAKAYDETENDFVDLLPVIFQDGKFYQDASFYNSTIDKEDKTIPAYDKLDITPIGVPQTDVKTRTTLKEKTCWNCDQPGHETRQCPATVDKERIEINRAVFLAGRGTTTTAGRYYEQLAFDNQICGLEPGRLSTTLRDALGLRYDQDEPPYYQAMRIHGYPPGYTGTYTDQEYVMKLVTGNRLFEDSPHLKIFDHSDDKKDTKDDKSLDHEKVRQERDNTSKVNKEWVRMVNYPGLYPSQITASNHQPYVSDEHLTYYQPQQSDSYWHSHHQNLSQQYYNQQAYTPAEQYYNDHYYHPSYDYNYYQSTDSHQNSIQHPSIQYQHYLHNQPPGISIHNTTIPPPPAIDQDDDVPPPPPPPPIDVNDDVPPPPPPINIDDIESPPPPPPPPLIT
ncbi:hypothetical protein BC941DRAFT_517502 [Chlamydoabsidia padenii]|nr:hypothetical protein BC941DRAFT_517502 [Chlamydoabsidia padenii]